MIKKLLGAMLLACSLSLVSGCNSGPKRLTRTWDDWTNQKYTENAYVHGMLLQDILPVYPLVGFVMAVGDLLIVNPYYFWAKDVWDGNGTGYNHTNPLDAERTVTGYMD